MEAWLLVRLEDCEIREAALDFTKQALETLTELEMGA